MPEAVTPLDLALSNYAKAVALQEGAAANHDSTIGDPEVGIAAHAAAISQTPTHSLAGAIAVKHLDLAVRIIGAGDAPGTRAARIYTVITAQTEPTEDLTRLVARVAAQPLVKEALVEQDLLAGEQIAEFVGQYNRSILREPFGPKVFEAADQLDLLITSPVIGTGGDSHSIGLPHLR